MTSIIGQLAALATSFAWSSTSVLFTVSGRQVGSPIVNRTRLLMGVFFVAIMHWITQGQLIPLDAEPFRWGWLALSGLIGFVIGDGFLFQAFVLIGPRLSMLLMALAPVISAVLGLVFLGEQLSVMELLGILTALSGIALVISDRPAKKDVAADAKPKQNLTGILFGLGGAAGQASGLLASKLGLHGDFPALSGNMIRLMVATLAIWLFTFFRQQIRPNFETLRHQPRALLAIIGGAVTGPFVGVWLSLIAIQRAPIGIASTLMSLSPIILLPVGRIFFDEQIGSRAIAGTILAVIGTALLFLPV